MRVFFTGGKERHPGAHNRGEFGTAQEMIFSAAAAQVIAVDRQSAERTDKMKQAVIDIGSNSMRLTLYEIEGGTFKILFRERIMAGLAGYVEKGRLSAEGIGRAYQGLLAFRETLDSLEIPNVAVFATASLRNIQNTDEAAEAIKAATGYTVEVISGEEEALLGYCGAMEELSLTSGAFMDIGGASTEIVAFTGGQPLRSTSFPIGSLNLYKKCVKKILPGENGLKKMEKEIEKVVGGKALFPFERRTPLVCVGGTARAALKLVRSLCGLVEGCSSFSAVQLEKLWDLLREGDREAADLVLKLEPDRIHTIVPGVMIMRHISRRFEAEEIIVSKYGVREGYLCQKILKNRRSDMSIRKIGS